MIAASAQSKSFLESWLWKKDFLPSFPALRHLIFRFHYLRVSFLGRCLSYQCFQSLSDICVGRCALIFYLNHWWLFGCRFFPNVLLYNFCVCHPYLQIIKSSKSSSKWTKVSYWPTLRIRVTIARVPCTKSRNCRLMTGTILQIKRRKWLSRWTASDKNSKNGSSRFSSSQLMPRMSNSKSPRSSRQCNKSRVSSRKTKSQAQSHSLWRSRWRTRSDTSPRTLSTRSIKSLRMKTRSHSHRCSKSLFPSWETKRARLSTYSSSSWTTKNWSRRWASTKLRPSASNLSRRSTNNSKAWRANSLQMPLQSTFLSPPASSSGQSTSAPLPRSISGSGNSTKKLMTSSSTLSVESSSSNASRGWSRTRNSLDSVTITNRPLLVSSHASTSWRTSARLTWTRQPPTRGSTRTLRTPTLRSSWRSFRSRSMTTTEDTDVVDEDCVDGYPSGASRGKKEEDTHKIEQGKNIKQLTRFKI